MSATDTVKHNHSQTRSHLHTEADPVIALSKVTNTTKCNNQTRMCSTAFTVVAAVIAAVVIVCVIEWKRVWSLLSQWRS